MWEAIRKVIKKDPSDEDLQGFLKRSWKNLYESSMNPCMGNGLTEEKYSWTPEAFVSAKGLGGAARPQELRMCWDNVPNAALPDAFFWEGRCELETLQAKLLQSGQVSVSLAFGFIILKLFFSNMCQGREYAPGEDDLVS